MARTYATALLADLGNVDFSQVMETLAGTIRKSIDQTEFLLKWDGADPSFIVDESVTITWRGDHESALVLMRSAAWTTPEDPDGE